MLQDTILDSVGNTPTVRLQRVGQGLACELYGKCEFMNPGGSIKDRIAVHMIEQAEREGRIKPGDTLIEATSGNTGIGFAMAGAIKGYKVVITMPEKMSHEKLVVIESLGAKIYRTPTEAKWDDPDSHLSLAKRLQKEIPNAHILDQYTNPANPDIHFAATAQEILDDFGQDLAMVVMGVGTGGTITGVAKRLKAAIPNIKIIGADPYGSILGGGTEVYPYLVEGIGYDFFPKVLDNSVVDEYVKVSDKDSFHMARKLIRKEGLLVGGSSGTALWAALQAARSLKAGQKCLVILPDSIRNYLSKFVDDNWLAEQGMM
jgi:cysteine synthase A